MIFILWILFLFEICLSLTTSSNLPEECNLKVEIDYLGTPEIDPAVICSSECGEAGKTFYYYEENLEKNFNSIVEIRFDEEGKIFCQIVPIPKIGSETSTTASETGSEATAGISSPYPDYPSQGPVSEFNEFNENKTDELQSENLDTSDSEYQYQFFQTENALLEIEYQSDTTSKDDESTEESNEPLNTPEEETKIEINESSTQITTPEEFQNEHQEADPNFETIQQEEIPNSLESTSQLTNQTPSPECSKGWTLNPNSSTCYLVTQNSMNWFDANIVCLQLGGKLSIFHSQEEINFVKENVELPDSTWIGLEYTLSDNLTVKTWRWIDRTFADFTDWATGEPSSETSLWDSFWAYENCVEMKKSDGFAWNDERCTNLKRGLCSKEAELTPVSCPEGWIMQNNRCYHFCTEELVEELADLQCSSHAVGVKLFAPQDQTEMDFVADKLKKRNISTIWLGIKDTQENGDFRSPQGEPQTFFSWDCKEPTTSFWWFNAKECVQMSSESRMRRAKCSQELPFVCVLDLSINK